MDASSAASERWKGQEFVTLKKADELLLVQLTVQCRGHYAQVFTLELNLVLKNSVKNPKIHCVRAAIHGIGPVVVTQASQLAGGVSGLAGQQAGSITQSALLPAVKTRTRQAVKASGERTRAAACGGRRPCRRDGAAAVRRRRPRWPRAGCSEREPQAAPARRRVCRASFSLRR